ncbi:hypothetical protein JR316_0012851 [Psilocybe cubensis]|uniref:Uncharacterized protein n=2 Tax=Psilocybe cubensis TaxID=181762 RepID=A0ACB8GFF8_PSICU|nr:hypothetical protein JR316_0012851 [Psilocybe cubensis]KAH9474393.1 hypothetical protein JR316_0012851 [Psilocybe cubensis]
MQLKHILLFLTPLVTVYAAEPTVLTAKRVYHTVIDQSPFLVERTSTVVWTQSPSITEAQPTTPPTPTLN